MAELPRPYQRQLLTEAVPTTDITPFIQSSRRESQALTGALDKLATVAFQLGKTKKAKQKEANKILADQSMGRFYTSAQRNYDVIDKKIIEGEYGTIDDLFKDLESQYSFSYELSQIDPGGKSADTLNTYIRNKNCIHSDHFFQSPNDKTEATPSTKWSAAAAKPMQ